MAESENPYQPPRSEAFVPEEQATVDYGSEQARRNIRGARIALVVVGVISLGVMTYYLVQLLGQLRSSGASLSDLPALSLLLFGLGFGVACTYLVLSFVARTRPFGASLAGLILFLTDILVGVIDDPHNLYRGIVLKVVIIVVLVRAVRAGLEYRRYHAAQAGPP